MSAEKMRCPKCGEILVLMEMHEVKSIDGQPVPPSSYYWPMYECPNRTNHGELVECANGCGLFVSRPRAHYIEPMEGLIGHGSWTCMSTSEREAVGEFLQTNRSRGGQEFPETPDWKDR